MATRKPKRPFVRVRNAEVDGAKIVEATSVKGTGLLIGVHSPVSDERVLYLSPYRADRDVYLMIAPHKGDCEVFVRRDDDRRCDCGACLTYDAASSTWTPTKKRV